MPDQEEGNQNQQQERPSPPEQQPEPPPVDRPPQQSQQPQPAEQPQQQNRDRRNQQQQQRHQQRQGQGPRHQGGRREGQQFQRGGGGGGGGNDLSIVIPVYNEEQSLRELYDGIRNAASRMGRFEVLFVDDGSTDGSVRVMQDLRQRDRRVKIIRFRRNYGKSAALSVGFTHADGNIIITMDADLQDDPDEIPNLVSEIKKGYDLVSGWKKKRHDPLTKTIPSRFFNFVTSILTGIRIHDFNCGLKAYRKEVAKEVKVYGELHRYIPVLAHDLGYKIGEVKVQHRSRKYGKTKFGTGRFWKGFLDLVTVIFTTRYLQRPLHLFGFWGMCFVIAGIAIDGYLVYAKFTQGVALSNWPLFTGGILMIIVGVQFVSVGLLGELISRTRSSSEREYSIREIWK